MQRILYNTCDISDCCSELQECYAQSALNPLRVGMLFWHDFADAGDLGIDRMNNSPLTMVNSPAQQVGTGFGGGFGLGGGGTATLAHATKPWGKNIFDIGRNNWTFAYWKYRANIGQRNNTSWTIILPDSAGLFRATSIAHLGLRDHNPPTGQEVDWFFTGHNLEDGTDYDEAYGDGKMMFPVIHDRWVHWVFTYDSTSGEMKVYQDGVEVRSIWYEAFNDIRNPAVPRTAEDDHTVAPYINQSFYDDSEMRFLRGDLRYFSGNIAEPAMWSRKLDDQEVTALAGGASFEDALAWIRG